MIRALRKGHRYLYGPLTMPGAPNGPCRSGRHVPRRFCPRCGFTTDFPEMAENQTATASPQPIKASLPMDASKVNGRGMYRFAELADVDTIVMDATRKAPSLPQSPKPPMELPQPLIIATA